MELRRVVVLILAVLLAGAAGWTLRGLATPPARTGAAPPSGPAAAGAGAASTAAVAGLEARTNAKPSPVRTAETEAPAGPPGEPSPPARTPLLEAIRDGDEADRYQGLLDASPGEVPPELLRHLLETDGSDRVRLAALEIVMESLAGHDDALRALLDEARLVPNAALQQEAERRLGELEERVRRGQVRPPPTTSP